MGLVSGGVCMPQPSGLRLQVAPRQRSAYSGIDWYIFLDLIFCERQRSLHLMSNLTLCP